MNAYYHSFEVGFNFWMVFGFIAVVAMGVLGYFTYRWSKPEPIKVVSDSMVGRAIIVCTIIFTIMLFAESSDGIIQSLDNHLDEKISAAWSLLAFPFAVLVIAVVFAIILYVVCYLASMVKLGRMYEQMRVQRERDRREYREAKRLAARQANRQYKQIGNSPTFMRSMTVIKMDTRRVKRRKHDRWR